MKAGGTAGLGVMEGSHLGGSSLEDRSESQNAVGSRENKRETFRGAAQVSLWRGVEGQQNGKGSLGMEAEGMEGKFRIHRCVSSCPVSPLGKASKSCHSCKSSPP